MSFVHLPQAPVTIHNVYVKDEPPIALYKHTLEGAIGQMQAEVAELQQAILDERRSRNTRRLSIEDERRARERTDSKLATLSAELKNCKARFALSGHEWWHGHQDLRKELTKIEARQNVQVDMNSGRVILLRQINFKQRFAGDAPAAEFCEPQLATVICEDIAAVALLFGCPVKVEGHTKGGKGKFWQTLADNRARLVADKIVEAGLDAKSVTTAGLPGNLGLHDSRVEVTLSLPRYADQPVSCLARPSIVTNGVVTNGVVTNGVVTNGVITNGVVTNSVTMSKTPPEAHQGVLAVQQVPHAEPPRLLSRPASFGPVREASERGSSRIRHAALPAPESCHEPGAGQIQVHTTAIVSRPSSPRVARMRRNSSPVMVRQPSSQATM